MRLLLGSLINTIPESHAVDNYVTATVPPLSITTSGADIDYSLLLFADQVVVDEESISFMVGHLDSTIKKIGNSIETLRKEGLAKTVNFRGIIEKYKDRIDRAAELAADNPQFWLPGVREHIRKYDIVRPHLLPLISGHASLWDEQIFPIANFYEKKGRKASRLAAKRLTNMILRKEPEQMTAGELERVREIICETVKGVGGQALVAEFTESRNYSWNTCDHILDMLASFRPSTQNPIAARLKGCRDFFQVAYPEFAPKSQTDWLRILRHKDVTALRRKIAEASDAGMAIDAEFARKEFVRLVSALGESGHTKTLVGRGIDGLGLATGATAGLATGGLSILAGILAGVAVGGAGIAAKESADWMIGRRVGDEFRWMYFMSRLPK